MIYDFAPMLPIYRKLSTAPAGWPMSPDGRRLMARAIRLARNKYGRQEGKRFRDALMLAGVLLPIEEAYGAAISEAAQ